MSQELLENIERYRELRASDNPHDLGIYDEMEQRLIEADHLIQVLARTMVEQMRSERNAVPC